VHKSNLGRTGKWGVKAEVVGGGMEEAGGGGIQDPAGSAVGPGGEVRGMIVINWSTRGAGEAKGRKGWGKGKGCRGRGSDSFLRRVRLSYRAERGRGDTVKTPGRG